MKVKDFIKDTIWVPGSRYDEAHTPAVSVLLPTFRRGKSGLFRKAVNSVLEQTLEDIELIIVDDASTDGTADQIAEFMEQDGRVSCLRHPYNIGLPAISEYEALIRARADHIAFAFDDDFFYPDALEKLLEASHENPGKVCFGTVIWRIKQKDGGLDQVARLGQPLQSFNMRSWNNIPNCAVMLPRHVIDDIGFYDPHILMTRICDWDLWRRASFQYLMTHVDVDVGEVTGPETNDSLGNTYTLTAHASSEWMQLNRDLSIENFPEIDIFATPWVVSAKTQETTNDLKSQHLWQRPHLTGPSAPSSKDKTILVLTTDHDASTTLCFDFLPVSVRSAVRIVRATGGFLISELAYASAVIIVRHLRPTAEWIATAKHLKIPLYYFLDDNLPRLVSEEGMKWDGSDDFQLDTLRLHLRDFAGILLSTKELIEYFDANILHDNLYFYPVSYATAPPKLPAKSVKELTFASIGGRHRQKGLQEHVLPSLRRIATPDQPVHFVIGGVWGDDFAAFEEFDPANKNLRYTLIPMEIDWMRAVLQLAQHRPDFLVHAPSKTENNKYKTLNVALCAYILDAVLVVPDDPPYSGEALDGCAVRVSPSNEARAWLHAVENALSDRAAWDGYKKSNALMCRTVFSGEQNVVVINEILGKITPLTSTASEWRLKELYITKGTLGRTPEPLTFDQLMSSIQELYRRRSKAALYRRIRRLVARGDIWPHVSPAFSSIQSHVVNQNIRQPSYKLELTQSISDLPYVEYLVPLAPGVLKNITAAFGSDGINEGMIGVELVTPEGTIACHLSLDSTRMNFQLPVVFDIQGVKIERKDNWRVRLFARSRWPIYLYEFANYSWFGLKRNTAAPFISIEYDVAEEKKALLIENKSVSRHNKKSD